MIVLMKQKWRSHGGGDHGGQSVTPDSEKFAKNREKVRKNREKRGKIGKKRQKSGSFFHFAPPDRQGWLRYCETKTQKQNKNVDLKALQR